MTPSTLRGGNTLSVNVVNPGTAAVVDVFFGFILPPAFAASFGCPADNTPIAFITAGGAIVKCPSDSPSTFPRFLAGVTVPGGLPLTTVPGFFTAPLPPGMPTGTYLVFFALARRGAFLERARILFAVPAREEYGSDGEDRATLKSGFVSFAVDLCRTRS